MIIASRVVGRFDVNAYLVGDENTGEAVIIDPGGSPDDLLALLETHRLTLKAILATHAGIEHVGAANALRDATGAPLLIHPEEAPGLAEAADRARARYGLEVEPVRPADGFMVEGELVRVGDVDVRAIETPGHTPGGVSFLADLQGLHREGEPPIPDALFTGDTLLRETIGPLDMPGADRARLLRSIREKLLALPPVTLVLPGHGPSTTVGHEARHNPFLNPDARSN